MQSAYKERNKSHNLSLATNSIFAISYWMTLQLEGYVSSTLFALLITYINHLNSSQPKTIFEDLASHERQISKRDASVVGTL